MTLDSQEEQLLKHTEALAKENNEILKKLRRAQVLGRVWSIVYWIVVVGLAFGAFYFLQPYIDQIKSIYGGIQEGVNQVQSIFGREGAASVE